MSEITTINIEGTDLRFVVFDGKRVKRWGSAPIKPGIVKEGFIVNAQAISDAIAGLIASKQLKKGKVVASLSGVQSVHRTINLPPTPQKLMAAAVMSEAGKAMPVPMDQIYLSWCDITHSGDEFRQFFLLGVPRSMVDAEVNCLRQAGIDIRFMFLKPLTLASLVNRSEALIIDIEPELCTITVVAKGTPTIIRSLVPKPDYTPSERAQYILREYEKTLQFYESSYPESPLPPGTSIFLTGQLANEEELNQTLAYEALYAIQPLVSPLACPSDFPLASFAVNIGLALNAFSLAAKHTAEDGHFLIGGLNVLPDLYQPQGLQPKKVLALAGVVAAVGLLFPFYQMVDSATAKTGELQRRSDSLKQQVSLRQKTAKNEQKQVKDTQAAIEKIKKQLSGMPDIRQSIADRQSHRGLVCNAMYKVIQRLPPAIILNQISESGSRVDLAGKVVIPNGHLNEEVAFSISLKIKEGSEVPQQYDLGSFNWTSSVDPSYAGYRIALDYADALRQENGLFYDVQLNFMNYSESTSEINQGEGSSSGSGQS